MKNDGLLWTIGGLACLLLLGLVLGWAFMFVTVSPGNVGLVSSFGSYDKNTLEPGAHVVWPWKMMKEVSVQTKQDEDDATAPTKEGLTVVVKATLLYRLSPESAVPVYSQVGKDYENIVVKPAFKSALRGATAHYDAKDLYTAKRDEIEGVLLEAVRHSLKDHGIVAEAVLLRDVAVPDAVKDRVNAKVAAEQDAQRMEYVLKQKRLEADAKVIEAKGIADAQQIIKKDLDDNYLKYLWIEALKESAKHNNATIYIPTGTDGMPMFTSPGHRPAKHEEQK